MGIFALATWACTSDDDEGDDSGSSGQGGGAANASGGAAGTGVSGSAGSTGNRGGAGSGGAAGSAGGGVTRPFFCPDYPQGLSEGWIELGVSLVGGASGPMDSPIQTCTLDGASLSVRASGVESDGVDDTVMSIEIAGGYHGPGYYAGTPSNGLSASFSHSDIGIAFASVSSTYCEICVNDDGLSGTLGCWGLESPSGSAFDLAHIAAGWFTCSGAQPKPATLPTTPREPLYFGGSSWLCHYLELLECPGRSPAESCVRTHDIIALDGPCSEESGAWSACIQGERPSEYRCAETPGDELVLTSGACATELSTMHQCRVDAGAGGNGSTGLETSPECDAYCTMLLERCGIACSRGISCRVEPGQCVESTRAYLQCLVTGDNTQCADGGGAVTFCQRDASLCP